MSFPRIRKLVLVGVVGCVSILGGTSSLLAQRGGGGNSGHSHGGHSHGGHSHGNHNHGGWGGSSWGRGGYGGYGGWGGRGWGGYGGYGGWGLGIGYGGYGWNGGYGGWNSGYYYPQSTYYYAPQTTYVDPQAGYGLPPNTLSGTQSSQYLDGGEIVLVSPKDAPAPINYLLNGYPYTMKPGETQRFRNDRPWVIEFTRGVPGSADSRYSLSTGRYQFVPSSNGWDLVTAREPQTSTTPIIPAPPAPGLVQ